MGWGGVYLVFTPPSPIIIPTRTTKETLRYLTITWRFNNRFNRLIRFLNYYLSSSLIHGFSSLNSCLFIFVCLSSIVRVCLRGAPHLTSPLPYIHFLPALSLPRDRGFTSFLLGTDSCAIGDWLHFYLVTIPFSPYFETAGISLPLQSQILLLCLVWMKVTSSWFTVSM